MAKQRSNADINLISIRLERKLYGGGTVILKSAIIICCIVVCFSLVSCVNVTTDYDGGDSALTVDGDGSEALMTGPDGPRPDRLPGGSACGVV
jgi:hypothetical protein